jgi:F-type H+-transporting ATPase subunit gamma
MARWTQIRKEKKLVESFQDIAVAYQEISLYTMQRIRSSILKNREFLEELSEIFFDVKISYLTIFSLLLKNRKNPLQIAKVKKNGKQIDILITNNSHLAGSLSQRVFEKFYQDIQTHTSDIFIIGKVGKELFEQKKSDKTYAYFEIPEESTPVTTLAPIINHILPYEKVNVYYGKFINVLTQEVVTMNLSGDQPIDGQNVHEKVFHFLFEPRLEDILYFFQTQVVTSLFNQSVHEGELARHASRITAMEDALRNIEEVLKKLTMQERKITQKRENKKQLQLLSGMQLWGGRAQ